MSPQIVNNNAVLVLVVCTVDIEYFFMQPIRLPLGISERAWAFLYDSPLDSLSILLSLCDTVHVSQHLCQYDLSCPSSLHGYFWRVYTSVSICLEAELLIDALDQYLCLRCCLKWCRRHLMLQNALPFYGQGGTKFALNAVGNGDISIRGVENWVQYRTNNFVSLMSAFSFLLSFFWHLCFGGA